MALGHREGNAFGRGLFVAVALSANLAIRAAAPLSRWDDRLRGSATSACDPMRPPDRSEKLSFNVPAQGVRNGYSNRKL